MIALAAIFVIAFGVGRAWGPDPQPATHESPTHGVVETTTVETGGSAPPPAHDDAHHDAGRHGQGGHDQDGGEH